MEQSGEYTWRTVKDGRVRSSHAMREGMTFKWTDPPDDGHPGEAFNCRCWAEQVVTRVPGERDEEILDRFQNPEECAPYTLELVQLVEERDRLSREMGQLQAESTRLKVLNRGTFNAIRDTLSELGASFLIGPLARLLGAGRHAAAINRLNREKDRIENDISFLEILGNLFSMQDNSQRIREIDEILDNIQQERSAIFDRINEIITISEPLGCRYFGLV